MSDRHRVKSPPQIAAPPLAARLIVSVLIAGGAGLYYWWGVRHATPRFYGDYVQHWVGARAVLRGDDPVTAVARIGWHYPLYYPLPTELIALPFALLPFVASECVFVGVGAGVLAFGMTKHRWWGLLIFLTPSFLHAYFYSQWPPLLTGAMLTPILGGLLIAKPSTGLAMFFSRPSWKGAVGAGLLVAISFLIRPGWVGEWRNALAGPLSSIPPVIRPGGFLLLLALPFWRRADARLLIGLALVPHRTLFYETLPLFTIPRSFRQMAVLVILGSVAAASLRFGRDFSHETEMVRLAGLWPTLLSCLYLPALGMMLWNARALPGSAEIPGEVPS